MTGNLDKSHVVIFLVNLCLEHSLSHGNIGASEQSMSQTSLCLTAHTQLLQVLHEHLQTDVVCEDWRPTISPTHPPGLVVVCLTWVHLAQKESGLAATLLCVNVSWNWEPRQKHLLSVRHRCLEQLLEVCIFRLMLVTCRAPLGDRLSMEDEDLEKSVHEQNTVRLDGAGIQQNWLGGAGEAIAVEDRLNHDECLREVLPVQAAPVENCFVRTVVEHLKELTSSEMEHELRVEAEILR